MARQRKASGEDGRTIGASKPATETRERLIVAAEELLRRHGRAKTNVVDVARALGMSHANVYRHFPSKKALEEAVTERWLRRISEPLASVAASDLPAEEKLVRWTVALARVKRRKVMDDPEMFSSYHALAESSRTIVERHLEEMQGQVSAIIRQGVDERTFFVKNVGDAARAALSSTASFHHPSLVTLSAGDEKASERELRKLLSLLIAGLKSGVL